MDVVYPRPSIITVFSVLVENIPQNKVVVEILQAESHLHPTIRNNCFNRYFIFLSKERLHIIDDLQKRRIFIGLIFIRGYVILILSFFKCS